MHYVFTLTTGRSGTAWMAEFLKNIPDSECHHERLGPRAWGRMTPDISTLMEYNTLGNTRSVRQFWKQKAEFLDANVKAGTYVETSHVLSKAGLIENIDLFPGHTIILLDRDPEKVARSMIRRGDYTCIGNIWIWLLDPGYAMNKSRPKGQTQEDLCHWYVSEMKLRRENFLENFKFNHVSFETGVSKPHQILTDMGYHGEFYAPPPIN